MYTKNTQKVHEKCTPRLETDISFRLCIRILNNLYSTNNCIFVLVNNYLSIFNFSSYINVNIQKCLTSTP